MNSEELLHHEYAGAALQLTTVPFATARDTDLHPSPTLAATLTDQPALSGSW
jgi:hypothetical protein